MPYTHPETGLPKRRPCFRILGFRCGKAATDSKEGHRLVNQASPYSMIKKQPLSQLALTALLIGEPWGKPPLIGEVAVRPERLQFTNIYR